MKLVCTVNPDLALSIDRQNRLIPKETDRYGRPVLCTWSFANLRDLLKAKDAAARVRINGQYWGRGFAFLKVDGLTVGQIKQADVRRLEEAGLIGSFAGGACTYYAPTAGLEAARAAGLKDHGVVGS